jgi:hypothetical protein
MRVTVALLCFILAAQLFASAPNQTISSRIPRIQLNSSAIASVGYSKHQHALEIEFHNGAIYRYLDVPASTYRELLAAPSKASYYDNHIRYRFHSVHVKPRR